MSLKLENTSLLLQVIADYSNFYTLQCGRTVERSHAHVCFHGSRENLDAALWAHGCEMG